MTAFLEAGEILLTTGRLDASYDWLPAPPQEAAPLVLFGNGCNDPRPYNLAGQVPLSSPHPKGESSSVSINLPSDLHTTA